MSDKISFELIVKNIKKIENKQEDIRTDEDLPVIPAKLIDATCIFPNKYQGYIRGSQKEDVICDGMKKMLNPEYVYSKLYKTNFFRWINCDVIVSRLF